LPFRGDVRLFVFEHWPRTGDIDAPFKGLLDALKKARILVDDDQVAEFHTFRFRDSETPRIEIEIEEL
jgi:Holliday junction resolvase RusA-like endonuclease